MLVDIEKFDHDPILAIVATTIGAPGPVTPERIGKGAYLAGHWNVDDLVPNIRHRWQEDEYSELPVPEHGVCDTPEQLFEKFDFNAFPEPVFVSFVKIRKIDQSSDGGWRWHKWGDYIGDRDRQHEYLYDEPEIDEVFTFSVHELKPAT